MKRFSVDGRGQALLNGVALDNELFPVCPLDHDRWFVWSRMRTDRYMTAERYEWLLAIAKVHRMRAKKVRAGMNARAEKGKLGAILERIAEPQYSRQRVAESTYAGEWAEMS